MLTRSYWISREKDHIIIIYNVIIYNIYNLTIYNLKAACEEISYHEKASAKTPNSTNRLLGTLDIFFFFFWPQWVACGILLPWPGIKPLPSAVKAQSSNHWTDSEFPTIIMTRYRTYTEYKILKKQSVESKYDRE